MFVVMLFFFVKCFNWWYSLLEIWYNLVLGLVICLIFLSLILCVCNLNRLFKLGWIGFERFFC